MFVDSHCHVHFSSFSSDLSDLVARMSAASVQHALCVSVHLPDCHNLLRVISPYSCFSASCGIHPDAANDGIVTEEDLLSLAQSSPRIVAIGETGLDYYRTQDPEIIKKQQELFRCHIRVARFLNKPLIIHCRKAGEDVLRILKEEKAEEVGGVMHCCTESASFVEQAIQLSFYISYSGIITFKNAEEIRSVAQGVPLSRLLIETDSPYLAPIPYRGKRNEPSYVVFVARKLSEIKGISLDELAEATTRNFFDLFSIFSS